MRLLKRDPNKGYIDDWLWVPKNHMNAEGTKNALTFTIATDRKLEVVTLWKEAEHHVLVPREFYDVTKLPFEVVDCRPRSFLRVAFGSRIQLDHRPVNGVLEPTGETVQRDALRALLAARGGTLQLACGKGKTVIFLELAHQLGVPTLIVVDNTQLLAQWHGEILRHLAVTEEQIGLIGDGRFDWEKPIVLATYQTIAARAKDFPERVRRYFGLVGFDEGHHLNAPTWSAGAPLIYGKRVLLTATPNRDDGLHIISRFHVGEIIFKDLTPEMIPKIYFLWTGFSLDMEDPRVAFGVKDKTGELHLKLLAGHFGQWRARLDYIISHVKKIVASGRKPLVVSESVDELVNLVALWNGETALYTDIPLPTSSEVAALDAEERQKAREALKEVKEKVTRARSPKQLEELEARQGRLENRLGKPSLTPDLVPVLLEEKRIHTLEKTLGNAIAQLRDPTINPVKRHKLEEKRREILARFRQHAMACAVERELGRRQRSFIKTLLGVQSDAGLLIEEVGAEIRLAMVRSKQVLFSIAKYGREGLDNPDIDTAFVCEPFSSRNILQQLLGRPSRRKVRKNTPIVVFMEDEIGPLIGMCTKLRHHLRDWPSDEGGPYKYEMIGHPTSQRKRSWSPSLPGLL